MRLVGSWDLTEPGIALGSGTRRRIKHDSSKFVSILLHATKYRNIPE